MEISKAEIKVGDIVTVLDFNRWGNPDVTVLRVERVGREYLYGKVLYNEDGKVNEYLYQTRIKVENARIFSGARWDINDAVMMYLRAVREHSNARESYYRSVASREYSKANENISLAMSEFDETNPKPKLDDFLCKCGVVS